MSGKVYELRFYAFNLQGKVDFKDLIGDRDFWQQRQSLSRVVGIWETELNGASEFFHFVEYDDLQHLLKVRKEQADHKELWSRAQKVVEQYGTFRNSLASLSPHTPQLSTHFSPSSSAVYELQTMRGSDSTPTLGKNGVLVARFCTIYGPANTGLKVQKPTVLARKSRLSTEFTEKSSWGRSQSGPKNTTKTMVLMAVEPTTSKWTDRDTSPLRHGG